MNKEDFAQKLVLLFPEKEPSLTEHYNDYNEMLGHVFFSDEINIPLMDLLRSNTDIDTITKYCRFIEEMWSKGDDNVVNVVDVTILERISDEELTWTNFGKHISDDFKEYINQSVLIENLMMYNVPRL